MLRKIMVLCFIGAIVAVVVTSATTLGVGGGVIQSGMDDDLTCDPDGVSVLGWGYESDDNMVYFVRVGHIHSACEGCSLAIAISDNSGTYIEKCWIGSLATTELQGGTPGYAKCSFSPPIPAQNIGDIRVTIEGGE